MTQHQPEPADGLTRALRHCDQSCRPRTAGTTGQGLVAILVSAAVWLVHELTARRAGSDPGVRT